MDGEAFGMEILGTRDRFRTKYSIIQGAFRHTQIIAKQLVGTYIHICTYIYLSVHTHNIKGLIIHAISCLPRILLSVVYAPWLFFFFFFFFFFFWREAGESESLTLKPQPKIGSM